MDIKTHNPAIRIHNILIKGKQLITSSPHINTIGAWRTIFPLQDDIEFLSTYLEFTSLTKKVKEYIESNYIEENERNIYLSYINPVISITNSRIFGNIWAETFSPINEHIINGIYMLSSILKINFSEQKISPEKLSEWSDEFNKIFNEINQTDSIDKKLKQLLLSELSLIIFTISQYEIFGSEGITYKIIESYARISFLTKNNIDNNNIVNKFKKAAYIVIGSIALASNLSQISGYDIKYLIEKPSEIDKIQLIDTNEKMPSQEKEKFI